MIAVRPKPWTWHHTRRLYHMSMLAVWVFLFLICVYGSFLVFWDIHAADVSIVAQVSGFSSEPPIIGGSGGPPTPEKNKIPLVQPKLNIDLTDNVLKQRIVDSNGITRDVVVFDTQFPIFHGQTNIPNCIIFFEIHSQMVIRSTVIADNKGNWSWAPSEPLEPGLHTLTATIYHPDNRELVGTTTLQFFVEPSPGKEIREGSKPIRLPSGGYVASAVDVVITIPNEARSISAGQEVISQVRLIRDKNVDKPTDIPIRFLVQDDKNNSLMSVEETVSMLNQLSIIKKFRTVENLRPGNYSIVAQVPSDTFIASSSDFFTILEPSVIVSSTEEKPNFFLVLQIFFGLGLLFFVISYFELRRFLDMHRNIKKLTSEQLLYN